MGLVHPHQPVRPSSPRADGLLRRRREQRQVLVAVDRRPGRRGRGKGLRRAARRAAATAASARTITTGRRRHRRARAGAADAQRPPRHAMRTAACRGVLSGRELRRSRPGSASVPLRRGLLAGAEDVLDAALHVVLRVALQPAVVLAAAELLDHRLDLGQLGDLGDDAGAGHERAADQRVGAGVEQQHLAELDRVAGLHVPVVDGDKPVRFRPVLAAAVLEDRVHGPTWR